MEEGGEIMKFNIKKKDDLQDSGNSIPFLCEDMCQESNKEESPYYVSAKESHELKNTEVDLRSICPPVRNQRTLGSCASHGVITCYESELIKAGKYVEMSELYHYYNARKADGNEMENVGMSMLRACQTLKSKGLSFEKYWPYKLSKAFLIPNKINYWLNKLLNKIPSYNVNSYFRADNISDALMWLDNGYILAAGIKMFPNFNAAFGRHRITAKDIEGVNFRKYGGHCINIVGFHIGDQKLLIRNSWGKPWGNRGYIWIDFDVWEQICFEMRIIKI